LNSLGGKFPDWANAELLTGLRTTNGTYTATADGWIYIDISPASSGSSYEFKISVNGFLFNLGGKYTSSAFNRVPFLFPVKTGDVILTVSSSTVSWADDRGPHFIPQR
jgi:hypothetical protein